MKSLIAIIMIIGFAATFGCATTGTKQAQLETTAWTDMCRLLVAEENSYECHRIMPPLVEYEKMRKGLYGYYDGSDTIYIREGLNPSDTLATLFHEMIHYLHVQASIIPIPGPAEQVCWSENEAWYFEGIYSNKDNSGWWRSYPHCWEFYGDTQYARDMGNIFNEINEIMDEWINDTKPGE